MSSPRSGTGGDAYEAHASGAPPNFAPPCFEVRELSAASATPSATPSGTPSAAAPLTPSATRTPSGGTHNDVQPTSGLLSPDFLEGSSTSVGSVGPYGFKPNERLDASLGDITERSEESQSQSQSQSQSAQTSSNASVSHSRSGVLLPGDVGGARALVAPLPPPVSGLYTVTESEGFGGASLPQAGAPPKDDSSFASASEREGIVDEVSLLFCFMM